MKRPKKETERFTLVTNFLPELRAPTAYRDRPSPAHTACHNAQVRSRTYSTKSSHSRKCIKNLQACVYEEKNRGLK
jgi:hypothetical protein